MCRSEVAAQAADVLVQLLIEIRDALCAVDGTDPAEAVIGPVDFGEVVDA